MASVTKNDFLIGIPFVEDIHDAVFAIDANSAPGPDDFSRKFYQHCWDIVGGDVVLIVRDFFHSEVNIDILCKVMGRKIIELSSGFLKWQATVKQSCEMELTELSHSFTSAS
ncbi:hypothetical protein Ddye_005353 [Dipteronia dyeriana]|uniref:Uncharacterized protein n=1 Tax=Dipteronia dyeriana TaxID=168575 RepID=A0AAD9XGA4_9ROSI|nr:hypothetical protein Ddye_005353 [Dipteronia dyeriana]